MATIHISIDELPSSSEALLERARAAGELWIDAGNESFHVQRRVGRTAAEALARLGSAADVEIDEEWSRDLQEIIDLRKTEPLPDPWA